MFGPKNATVKFSANLNDINQYLNGVEVTKQKLLAWSPSRVLIAATRSGVVVCYRTLMTNISIHWKQRLILVEIWSMIFKKFENHSENFLAPQKSLELE